MRVAKVILSLTSASSVEPSKDDGFARPAPFDKLRAGTFDKPAW
jgi:hypothetical protein